MAVASRQQQEPGAGLTRTDSPPRGWDFAVPLDDSTGNGSYGAQPFSMSADAAGGQRHPSRQPLAVQTNGAYHDQHFTMFDSHSAQHDDEDNYYSSNQMNGPKRRGSDLQMNGGAPDGTQDYNHSDSKHGSRNAQTQHRDKRKKSKPVWGEAEKDESNWIHRDKLKEIEIREMEAAGFRVGRSSRSNSRSQSANRSRSRKGSEATNYSQGADDRQDHRPAISPIPAEDEEEGAEPTQWDLRTPEEIAAAADREMWANPPIRQTHVIRPSTSRIPVAKTSPAPVPATFVDRDAPLPRSRGGSANWTGDPISVRGARVRSGSTSSAVLLDEPKTSGELLRTPMSNNLGNQHSPLTGSPPKGRTPAKNTPTSGGRKTSSAQRSGSQSKGRISSANTPHRRPGTSGGSVSRPTTSHRPEGEAPWIATMYKPDPRLPPDQQIIPTHAKRMQQEQWENEGRVGSMYDKEFRLLNTDEFRDKRASQVSPLDLEKKEDANAEWPLPSPTKLTPEQKDAPAKSPTSEQGGYKLTPTIPQSPHMAPRPESRQAPAIAPNPPRTRMPEEPENEKEKKGCCCIVM